MGEVEEETRFIFTPPKAFRGEVENWSALGDRRGNILLSDCNVARNDILGVMSVGGELQLLEFRDVTMQDQRGVYPIWRLVSSYRTSFSHPAS